ncbi:MAG: hypothetical protein J6J86_07825 [Lachnospiraceae bacterium]|nr:hypothetical protein [Lachnospiraceae bacterium]
MQRRNEEIPVIVRICDKRLLSVTEFCAYSSIGRNKAMEVAEAAGAISRMGKRVLIDRVKFDEYCDNNDILL